MTTLQTGVMLLVVSFLPPLLYTIWIRNTERCHRQQWVPIFLCFLWGATIAIVASFVLEIILQVPLRYSVSNGALVPLLITLGLAPVVEEFTKPLVLGLRIVKKSLTEIEDGLIYGAVAGLGFSATENLLYGYSFLSEGLVLFFVFMALRSVGACLLHASATAFTGYGYGKAVMKQASFLRVLPYFFFAIFLHGFYNFLLNFEMIGALSGLTVALTVAIISISMVRRKIKLLDGQNC